MKVLVQEQLPSRTDVIVIGAGIAGASTAAALARLGAARGLILERESTPGTHASGRNAAIARQLEAAPELLTLSMEGVRQLRLRRVDGRPVLSETGGVYLYHGDRGRAAAQWELMQARSLPAELLTAQEARERFPFLGGFEFDHAIYSPTDGVIDIHALLLDLLAEARRGGFTVVTDCAVDSLIMEEGAVCGVRTARGEVRADVVVDAGGAWAGRLGRESNPLPLRPLRRHLFVGGNPALPADGAPFVWDLDVSYYLRPEGDGLLLSPCDETESAPGVPAVDPAAADLLADKLLAHAPALADLEIRRSWACLRTFAPDRLPVIAWDPEIRGLFHVAGLGGFGVTTSLAVGELAARRIRAGSR